DNNGVNEFAVSSRHFDIDKGFTSIFILVPDAQGNITDYKELNIVTTLGKGFDGHYPIQAIKSIGDFDANGTSDLLVNQFANDNGLGNTGKMIILLFDNNYKVIDTITISNSQNNLSFLMPRGASIGMNLDSLWDIDGNGVTDFFATTSGLSSPNPWLAILMNRDGSVASEIKINSPTSYSNIASVIGDVDGDGVKDIVSKHIDSSKVYITLINDNFSIKENYEVNLGLSLSINGFNALGDIDDNGAIDFMISGSNIGSGGVRLDDGVFIVSMNTNRTVKNISIIDYTDLPGATYDIRSSAPQAMDIDNDGKLELLIGDRNYSNSTSNSGAIHIVDLTASP
ncbi:MAG: VCBS repeat-containing protein, partial [Algicola sp.]|nr:VCBS repeat-containing protein [Algicola sp.]